MKDKTLTKKQLRVLDYIKKYIAINSYAPSIREICKGIGVNSSATIHAHLNNLVEKGYIKKNDFKFRTIEIIGENEYIYENKGLICIPLINEEELLSNNFDNKITISKELLDINKNSFLLKKDNDIYVIKKQEKYSINDTIIGIKNNNLIIIKYNNYIKNIYGKVTAIIKKEK